MVELTDVSEIWDRAEKRFEQLRARIQGLLPDAWIEHVGSTAVPGSITKGDVDLAAIVKSSDLSEARRILDQHFVHNPDMPPTSSFVSYSGASDGVGFGIQLFAKRNKEFGFLVWRDALRHSPELLQKYNRLKVEYSGKTMEEYRQAKSDFIEKELKNQY